MCRGRGAKYRTTYSKEEHNYLNITYDIHIYITKRTQILYYITPETHNRIFKRFFLSLENTIIQKGP